MPRATHCLEVSDHEQEGFHSEGMGLLLVYSVVHRVRSQRQKPVYREAVTMIYMYTAEQMRKVFEGWGVIESLPRLNGKVIVAFPAPANPSQAVVTRMKEKSTYGKALYRVEMT